LLVKCNSSKFINISINLNIIIIHFTLLLNPWLRAETLRQAVSPLKRERTFSLSLFRGRGQGMG